MRFFSMTMQSFESEKLKCAADISYTLAAEITDLLKLREALQTARGSEGAQRAKPHDAGRVRKKLNRIRANRAFSRLFIRDR
jgi:hypothetical protein